ncbi:SusC/RagA family TonB-linked outer membrane protein [Paraflavitalea pollutisoli]|uniref:SusC/RagA family TonB-linked outer membrane protein n=1 Tax=Paraflavitalea pollutisoli TaxID=3034143 RepID=UPI0023EC3FE8|nr:SusC/RagA family TonB-linked outer membrane protein [Paraflavitalea sp. H1-2-19X]
MQEIDIWGRTGKADRSPLLTKLLLSLTFLLLTTFAFAQEAVTGQIRVAEGPAVGATITVKGSTVSAQTDAEGKFKIAAKPGDRLEVTYVGHETQTLTVPSSRLVSVLLSATSNNLDQVVVIGYGQARKKDLTGAITQIKPDKLADQNPNTVQDVLRGTPGLSVGLDPNAKGGGSIQIRGQRSVYTDGGHNDPLIVLDGMIFYGELSEINPDDIAQIDVLKDASAAAVYGARSANGVLIVSTKRGQKGKPKINFTSNFGATTMAANRKVFDAAGYMRYREDWYTAATYGPNTATGTYDAYQTPLTQWSGNKRPGYYAQATAENLAKYGITIDQWRAYDAAPVANNDGVWARRLNMADVTLKNFLDNKTFDWYDQSFQTGTNQDYNISVSGANDNANYYLSAGYLENKGIIVGDNYRAIRSNLKVENKVTKWLEIGANVNFQNRTDGSIATDWQKQVIRNSPYAQYYDATGKLAVHPQGDAMLNNYGYNYDFDKQYLTLDKGYTVINAIINAKVKLPFGITYSFNASPRYQQFRDRYHESASHPDWKTTNGLINREQTQRFDYSLNNTINWEKTFATKHRVAVTLVQEAEKRQGWKDRIEARDIRPSDILGYHEVQNADKAKSNFDSEDITEAADGLLGRLFYSYDDRYMFTASFRRDGYSAFGSDKKRANFLSAAVAWTFTNEKFFNWEPMTSGKFRFSYGQNGNRSLADVYLAFANLTAGTGATQGYLDNNGNLVQYKYLFMDRLANTQLSWEKTESANFGLDFGFLNDRITGSFDYYITPTVDMIMNRTLPGYSGAARIASNLGKVVNKGFEITINTTNIKTKDFTWNTTFGFSKYRSEIQHLYYEYTTPIYDGAGNITTYRERDDVGNRWFIGQPIGVIWDYKVTGIWQKEEEAEAKRYGQRPGDPKVENSYTADDIKNPNGTVTPQYNDNDKQFLGQSAPPIMWSLRNDFTWKNFNFAFNLYSYMGHKSLAGIYLNQDNGTSLVTNLANTWKKDYWTVDNPTTTVARLDAKGVTGVGAPGMLYDRSFIRLENISIGYTLPRNLVGKAGIERVKVFASVRNVAVWTKQKNWEYGDIETFNTSGDANQMFRSGMAPRAFNFGLNVTL